jgi:3-methyladenine DNA glycosylase/8-oxoguanine DNA glycosylase
MSGVKIPIDKNYNFRLTAQAYSLPWMWDGRTLKLPLEDGRIVRITQEEGGILLIAERITEAELKKIRFTLGLDEDLSEFYSLWDGDALLHEGKHLLFGVHMKTVDLFSAILIAILQQNASFRQGWFAVKRVFENFGKKSQDFIFPPKPEDILKDKDSLKRCGVGYRENVIERVASAFLRGYFEGMEELPKDTAISRLKEIKGIGEYTAKVTLLFAFRNYEVFPVDRWFSRLLPVAYDREEALDWVAQKYKGWIGLFAYFVTIVTDALPIRKALERVRDRRLTPNLEAPFATPMTLFRH